MFQAHIDGEMVGEIRELLNGGMALGDSHFRKKVERLAGRRVMPEKTGAKKRKPRSEGDQGVVTLTLNLRPTVINRDCD